MKKTHLDTQNALESTQTAMKNQFTKGTAEEATYRGQNKVDSLLARTVSLRKRNYSAMLKKLTNTSHRLHKFFIILFYDGDNSRRNNSE